MECVCLSHYVCRVLQRQAIGMLRKISLCSVRRFEGKSHSCKPLFDLWAKMWLIKTLLIWLGRLRMRVPCEQMLR